MARKTTQEEVDKALELKMEGKTNEEVAEALNRSVEWVWKYTKGCGYKGKASWTTCKNVVAEQNKRLSEQKKKLREITCIPTAFGGYNTV